MPPASSALFQLMPQSLRSSLPVAITPLTVRPYGSLIEADGPSTIRTTGFVTPCMVRSPVTLNLLLAAFSILVDLKVSAGNLAASKKSGDFRWVSRLASRVSMEAVSMLTSTVDLVASFSSSSTVPLTFWNWPLTVVTIMWRTLNSTVECGGSISHVLARAKAGDRTNRLAVVANSLCGLMLISSVRVGVEPLGSVCPKCLMLAGAKRC